MAKREPFRQTHYGQPSGAAGLVVGRSAFGVALSVQPFKPGLRYVRSGPDWGAASRAFS